jgi:hypothetical protein
LNGNFARFIYFDNFILILFGLESAPFLLVDDHETISLKSNVQKEGNLRLWSCFVGSGCTIGLVLF